MTLDTLEQLADAAIRENGYAYCNPATIKSLIALCRQQHEALHGLQFSYTCQNVASADEALAAFERFDKGE